MFLRLGSGKIKGGSSGDLFTTFVFLSFLIQGVGILAFEEKGIPYEGFFCLPLTWISSISFF